VLLVVAAGHVSKSNIAVHLKKRENCGSCQWEDAAGRPGIEVESPSWAEIFYFS
jgi:hypothetical protein